MSDRKNDDLTQATGIMEKLIELFLTHPDFDITWVEDGEYERWSAFYRQLLSAFEFTTHRIGAVEKSLQARVNDLGNRCREIDEKLTGYRAKTGDLRKQLDLGTLSLSELEREQELLERYIQYRERFCAGHGIGAHQYTRHLQENRSIMEHYVTDCRALEETRKKLEALIGEEDRLLRELIETEDKKLKEFR